MMVYYGELCLVVCIINYCFDSINSSIYDNIRVYTYCCGEQRLLFDNDISNKYLRQDQLNYDQNLLVNPYSNQDLEKELQQSKCCDYLCSNLDLLKHAHSLQEKLSLIVSTECCTMERKDGEWDIQAITQDPDPEVKLYTSNAIDAKLYATISNDESCHQAYL